MSFSIGTHHDPSPTLRTVISDDSTPIEYLTLGDGPGLIILHGAMQSARSQIDLAQILAHHCTLHLVNRRGRGRSGGDTADLATEVADLDAVMRETRTNAVLGVSSGALIAARAALSIPQIRRLALFEPPLVVDGSLSLDFIATFEQELADDDVASAMVTAMLGAQMAPGFMAMLPRFLLRGMTRRMLSRDDAKPLAEGEAHLRDLAVNLRQDFSIVRDQANHVSEFAPIDAEILLINGERSRPYLRRAVTALNRVLPHARRMELAGAEHGATQNRQDRGNPKLVADAILPFFVSQSLGQDRPVAGSA